MIGDALLRGTHIYLDALERKDMEELGKCWRSLDLTQYLSQDAIFPFTPEDEMEWFDHVRKDKSSYVFAVRLRSDGSAIGTASLFEINWRIRKCVFGIAIGYPEQYGKGYGTEALRVILRYAFLELGLNRVQLHVYEFNKRAMRSYEKVGFVKEGVLRDAVYREGRYWDEVVMAILRREWKNDLPTGSVDDAAGDRPEPTRIA